MAVNGLSIAAAQEEVTNRKRDLERIRDGLRDTSLAEYVTSQRIPGLEFEADRFSVRRTLSGHTGKIYSLDWSGRDTIVSASQDGRLIVWNAMTSQKTHAIKLQCPWVMACAFSPDGETVVCGGLDNVLSVFNLRSYENSAAHSPPSATMIGHKGYISCCRFVPGKPQVLTSSGDYTCMLWDLSSGSSSPVSTFGGDSSSGHTSNVMSVSINRQNPSLFVTGSCDKTAKLWDMRVSRAAQCTFFGHTEDVNAVQFLPDGHVFGTGSDDGSCKLFDMRYGYKLQDYVRADYSHLQVNAIAFSHSGRILAAGYGARNSPATGREEAHASSKCILWDVLRATPLCDVGQQHGNQISCMGMAPDGSALCTGSWDNTLKVWAYSS